MMLAKYMSLMYGIKSVVEGSFKLSKASEFNDPFDCDGRLTDAAPPTFLEPEDIKRLRNVDTVRYLDAHALWACRFRNELDSKKLIDKYYRIMCFRKYTGEDTNADRLFWSHYADNGAGIRVIFNLEASDLPGELQAISYSKERPVYDLSRIQVAVEDPEMLDFMHQRVFTKGEQWQSEDEVRLCVPLNGEGWKPYGSDDVIFLPIDHKKIVGVDFGVNVSDAEAKSWSEICRGKESLKHVKFRKAEKNGSGYSYSYPDLWQEGGNLGNAENDATEFRDTLMPKQNSDNVKND